MTESMRQWWVVPGPTGGETELRTVEIPAPDRGQVLVKVEAAAINRGELIARPLLVSTNPKAGPAPSGIEFAGVIAAVGGDGSSGETGEGWSVGDRVMGRGSACHADYTVAPLEALMPVPDGLTWAEAGAVPNVFVTAHDAIVSNAALESGQAALITAGSSGVGTAAIQIARHLGAAQVVATTTSPAKADALQDLGATAVVDTTAPDWPERVVERGGPMDVIIDQVGGPLLPGLLRTMAIGGHYVTVGRTGGKQAPLDLDLVARNRLRLIGVTFRTRSQREALACSQRFVRDLLPAFDDGSLTPTLDRTFPLDQLTAAHDHMLSDRQVGKIVLVP